MFGSVCLSVSFVLALSVSFFGRRVDGTNEPGCMYPVFAEPSHTGIADKQTDSKKVHTVGYVIPLNRLYSPLKWNVR